jgi:DNA-binding response OmpR family regulator
MSRLLLLSPSAESVIPTLSLLPHDVIVAPLTLHSVERHSSTDLVVIDGVTDLTAAKSLASALASAHMSTPLAIVIAETSLSAIDGTWGVSDFLLPTASLAEIDARIRLLLTRAGNTATTGLSHSGVTVDESSYSATASGRALDLTFKEFELLRFLVANPGRVFTREQLLSDVWGYDYFGGTRTVDVHVRRLRAKLGDRESVISTVRNVGYRFAPTGEDE